MRQVRIQPRSNAISQKYAFTCISSNMSGMMPRLGGIDYFIFIYTLYTSLFCRPGLTTCRGIGPVDSSVVVAHKGLDFLHRRRHGNRNCLVADGGVVVHIMRSCPAKGPSTRSHKVAATAHNMGNTDDANGSIPDGPTNSNALTWLSLNGLFLLNGFTSLNRLSLDGFTSLDGLSLDGFTSLNGLSLNGFTSLNGLLSLNGFFLQPSARFLGRTLSS